MPQKFLSTPSGWRATCTAVSTGCTRSFLSTPSGWRATPGVLWPPPALAISIHALRVEGDSNAVVYRMLRNEFLSTPSGWRATPRSPDRQDCLQRISIHALRVEGDSRADADGARGGPISIHALRVEGDGRDVSVIHHAVIISIHALRVEGDSKNGQSFRLFLRKREKNLPL